MKKIRLDIFLVENGYFDSSSKAQANIMAGNILVDDQKIDKPGTPIKTDSRIRILGDTCPYVSRGGLKLEGALKEFNYDQKNQLALDIGASTGGFTDCLLQKGARAVIAVDVGHNQLDYKLRADNRVLVVEKFNARNITKKDLESFIEKLFQQNSGLRLTAKDLHLATMDVSFISITKILPALYEVLPPAAHIISLVKPQFEAEKKQVEKGGLIKDSQVHQEVIDKVTRAANECGYHVLGICTSPITGTDGNKEFFIHLKK